MSNCLSPLGGVVHRSSGLKAGACYSDRPALDPRPRRRGDRMTPLRFRPLPFPPPRAGEGQSGGRADEIIE